ncbi:MAG: hypothetical protein KDE15_08605 [Erythrobacter sp.]|nr:hypothetical protein [Erythrobacter sp.]
MLHRFLAILLCAATLSACATVPPVDTGTAPLVAQARCAGPQAAIDTDFPTGALASCTVEDDGRVAITIAPEDAPPINCSAWYAFRLTPAEARTYTVDLNYTACGHRYWPRYSHDGMTWHDVAAEDVEVTGTGEDRAARIRLHSDGQPVFIAGQEIVAPATYDAWIAGLAGRAEVTALLLGQSAEHRDIPMLRIAAPEGGQRETVVLLGRQHPPEVTGALAMFAFVDTVLGESDLARTYRARFETLVIPMLNPDGVVHGYWRHGTGGLDLNRDWGPFTQPETRLMRDLLEGVEADPARDLRLFLDFHSTRHDTVYTLTDAQVTDPPHFRDRWLARYAELLPGYDVRVEPGHNPELPVSKAWVYDRYGVPTATYEIGDRTDRALIRQLGMAAAQAMMETMLASDPPAR